MRKPYGRSRAFDSRVDRGVTHRPQIRVCLTWLAVPGEPSLAIAEIVGLRLGYCTDAVAEMVSSEERGAWAWIDEH